MLPTFCSCEVAAGSDIVVRAYYLRIKLLVLTERWQGLQKICQCASQSSFLVNYSCFWRKEWRVCVVLILAVSTSRIALEFVVDGHSASDFIA